MSTARLRVRTGCAPRSTTPLQIYTASSRPVHGRPPHINRSSTKLTTGFPHQDAESAKAMSASVIRSRALWWNTESISAVSPVRTKWW